MDTKAIIVYLVVINIAAFAAMKVDKGFARNGSLRIPERALLTLALIGGSIGGVAGMYTFHHKTRKPLFFIGFPAILILQLILVAGIVLKHFA